MKRFSFPLERVLDLRRHELEAAEARLHVIQSQREQARRRAASLERQFFEFGDESLQVDFTTGSELRAAESYLQHLLRERRTQLREEQKSETERQEQVRHVMEARRKVRLLERLRERREGQHLAEASRELETRAAELHLAKWVRERRAET